MSSRIKQLIGVSNASRWWLNRANGETFPRLMNDSAAQSKDGSGALNSRSVLVVWASVKHLLSFGVWCCTLSAQLCKHKLGFLHAHTLSQSFHKEIPVRAAFVDLHGIMSYPDIWVFALSVTSVYLNWSALHCAIARWSGRCCCSL